MAVVLADASLYRFTGGEPPSVADLERRYAVQTRGHSADRTETWINSIVVLGARQEPIGYVQATIPEGGAPAEIAWVIGVPWQGRGYAARAAALLVEALVRRRVDRIIAHIHPEHAASQRIATRLGMLPTSTVVDGEIRWEVAIAAPATAVSLPDCAPTASGIFDADAGTRPGSTRPGQGAPR
ncbi:GNAT family N-acetyltransferase [Agrococcus sp. ARC_14]|nr:GNAT family N-acetyltransferase [Agrococcus sp. ARC_14]